MKRLGVDPGERRIGLAVAGDGVDMALPLRTVAGGAGAAERVAEAVHEVGAQEVVVGLPLKLDGTEGPAARRARAFGEALGRQVGVPIRYWDERLTTREAERALREVGVRGAGQRRIVDRNAAALILQGYVDAHRDTGDEAAWLDDAATEDDRDGDADPPPAKR
jgi:putative holliday junction resolvase